MSEITEYKTEKTYWRPETIAGPFKRFKLTHWMVAEGISDIEARIILDEWIMGEGFLPDKLEYSGIHKDERGMDVAYVRFWTRYVSPYSAYFEQIRDKEEDDVVE